MGYPHRHLISLLPPEATLGTTACYEVFAGLLNGA